MKKQESSEKIMQTAESYKQVICEETNDTLPIEFHSPYEISVLLESVDEADVKIPDDQIFDIDEQKLLDELDEKVKKQNGKSENLVQTYFHSLGNISVLKRDEEIELARKMEEGKNIIKRIITKMPLFKKLESEYKSNGKEGNTRNVLFMTLEKLKELMHKVDFLDKPEHKNIESHFGIDIKDLKNQWIQLNRALNIVEESRNELIIHNLRIVVSISKKYIGRSLPLLDLIQEGNIGLIKAVDRFKYKMGCKFSTYASWWIKQMISRALMEQTKIIKIPVNITELYNKIIRASRELTQQLEREPTIDEIAEKLKVPSKKIEKVLLAMQDQIALQTPVGDDDTELEAFIDDKSDLSNFSDIENNLNGQLEKLLDTLSPREQQVIRMRFGIGVERNLTLEEIGRHFSITRERVRQIEMKALNKLKYQSKFLR